MLSAITNDKGKPLPHDPALRGYHAVYREHEVNHCPGCGRTHWYIGRMMAECGFCATALPLADASIRGVGHGRAFRPVRSTSKAA
jgi:hypothetical protein